ncbi:MAG: hypothetical protein HW400_779 [Candidatus Levybacteria bacterium]|nr:hypothetical protein [Candidatus Levybacteria bacterium]
MTLEEADKISRDWKAFAEINDKLWKIFTSIPESFLPYPSKILEEALNIVAKSYYDERDIKTSDIIKNSISLLIKYKKDEDAIEDIADNFILKNPKSREAYLSSLKRTRDFWLESRKKSPRCYKCGHIANVIKDDSD